MAYELLCLSLFCLLFPRIGKKALASGGFARRVPRVKRVAYHQNATCAPSDSGKLAGCHAYAVSGVDHIREKMKELQPRVSLSNAILYLLVDMHT